MQKRLSIQESNSSDYSDPSEASSFKIVRKIGGQGTKRRKTSHLVLPEVHTFHATEVSAQSAWELSRQLTRSKASVTLEEVENVDDFVNKLDKLELPNQLVAVLEDPLLQKLLLLKPSSKKFPAY